MNIKEKQTKENNEKIKMEIIKINLSKKQAENEIKNQKGITLLVLVITIIILLILAGITISAITGDNGIIRNAGKAKEEVEIDNEREIVEKATVQAMGNNKYGNLEEGELQEQLDRETGEGKTDATDIGDEFEVVFNESNRYYTVDKDGNVGEAQNVVKDKYPGDITVGKDGEKLDGRSEEEGGKPYEIWCIEDLIEWSQHYTEYQNSNIVLCKNLNFKSSLSYANCESIEYGDINKDNTTESLLKEMQKGIGFTPIENFAGIFDGKYEGKIHKIDNMYIYIEENAGLFKEISGTITNINISGEITSENSYAGGLASVGRENSLISNCVNNCNVKTNSERENANGNSYGSAGGIVGRVNRNMVINNCVNNGKIYGTTNAGGICGYEYASSGIIILNCANTEQISSENNAGGIVGGTIAGSLKIYNCYNIGNVVGINAGGLLGYKYHTTGVEIKNFYNYANITGESYQGEFIGYNWANNTASSPTIENVFYTNQTIGTFGESANVIGTPEYCEDVSDEGFVKKLNDYVKKMVNEEIQWNDWSLGEKGYPVFIQENKNE